MNNTWYSKRKQKLYEKFLRNRISVNKENYETFVRLFESIKQKSKKKYYHDLLVIDENDMKRSWATINEIIGPKKSSRTLFPKRLVANDLDFFNKKAIAENFNKFLRENRLKPASKLPHSFISFEHFLHGDYPFLKEKPITDVKLFK